MKNPVDNLNTLLQDALGGGEPKQDTAGVIRLLLDFSGSSVQCTVTGTEGLRFTLQLSGLVENGFCQLTDQPRTVVLAGQCSADGFHGELKDDPEYGVRTRLQLSARASSTTDFDERDLAQAGDVDAIFLLGLVYQGEAKTDFVRRDISQAMRWFEMGANAGHAPSMYSLGFIHYEGQNGDRDDAAALAQFTRCAGRTSDLQAQCHLVAGSMHFGGRGTPENRAKVAAHWRSCAGLGEQDCAARLARFGL